MKLNSKLISTTLVILLVLSISCHREKRPETPNLKSNPPTAALSKEEEWRKWQNDREAFRVMLFSIPLDEPAGYDRMEAWTKLAIPDDQLRLSGDQFRWAKELLGRYENGKSIEKLVFWRLVAYRKSSHHPGAIVRNLGDQYSSMADEQLEKILYSALGATPEKLPYDEAVVEGLRIIEKAAK